MFTRRVPKQAPQFAEPPLKISGDAARYDRHDGDDPYTQPGDLFRLMTPDEQDRLTTNIAKKMETVTEPVKQKMLGHFYKGRSALWRRDREEARFADEVGDLNVDAGQSPGPASAGLFI